MTTIRTYRPEIDGLRGIAILLVIIFHAKIFEFEFGFVGVDIFFVISGYLINGIIIKKNMSGEYQILPYFERRLLRIVPALTVALISTLFLSFFYTIPSDFIRAGKDSLASIFFASNFVFEGSFDYFSRPSELNPFIHLWSLSIEVQLYVLFGVLGLFYRKISHLFLVILISFLSFVYFIFSDFEFVYFSLFARLWEFALGAVVAHFYIYHNARHTHLSDGVIAVVILFFLLNVFFFHQEHRKVLVVFSVIAVSTLLYLLSERSKFYRLFTFSPLAFVGLCSYSAYLFHQPAFVILRNRSLEEPGFLDYGFVISLVLIFSTVSYFCVEKVFYSPKKGTQKKIICLSFGILLVVLTSIAIIKNDGFPNRYPSYFHNIINADKDKSSLKLNCEETTKKTILDISKNSSFDICLIGDEEVAPSIVIWGDSHVNMYGFTLDKFLRRMNKRAFFFRAGGCPPILGADRVGKGSDCSEFNEAVWEKIQNSPSIEIVMIGGRFSLYFYGRYDNREGGIERGNSMEVRLNHEPKIIDDDERVAKLLTKLANMFSELSNLGKKLVIFYPNPEVGYEVPQALAKSLLRELTLTHSYENYKNRQKQILDVMDSVKGNVMRIFPDKVLCRPDTKRCEVLIDEQVVYHDNNHLTTAGANKIIAHHETELRNFINQKF